MFDHLVPHDLALEASDHYALVCLAMVCSHHSVVTFNPVTALDSRMFRL